MDIKGIVRNILPFGITKPTEAKATSTTDADNDREGNGQAAGEEKKRRQLTADELQEAVKYLESLPGVKENNLTVHLEQKNDISVVYVQDREGKVVRRIPESELTSLLSNRQKKSGNLLNKAM